MRDCLKKGDFFYATDEKEQAFTWYKLAADMDTSEIDCPALYYMIVLHNVAQFYRLGIGVSQNINQAFIYYQKAINYSTGFGPSFFELAQLYEAGIGIGKNKNKAIEYYEKASKDDFDVKIASKAKEALTRLINNNK